jgi:phage-related protein
MMVPGFKSLRWVGTSRRDLRSFPKDARGQAGRQLWRVQNGREPTDWKPMRGVGAGASEIRVHTDREHRVIYVARFEEAVYVLHAFEKKTRKTPRRDVEIARRRLAAIEQARRQR